MKLDLNPEDHAFLDDIRTFLAESLDPELANKVRLGYPVSQAEQVAWTRKLNA